MPFILLSYFSNELRQSLEKMLYKSNNLKSERTIKSNRYTISNDLAR